MDCFVALLLAMTTMREIDDVALTHPARRARFGVVAAVYPHSEKYFRFPPTQITALSATVSSHHKGRIAIVTDAGRDAVDANVLLTSGTEADGKDVWS
jgi:hypothetical protein